MRVLLASVLALSLLACGESKEAPRGAASQPPTTSTTRAARPTATLPADLVGRWRRTLTTFDKNANDVLDADESTDSEMPSMGFAGLDLAADGRCTLERLDKQAGSVSADGTCGVLEEDGKRFLELEPGEPIAEYGGSYRILSATPTELVLKDPTGPNGAIYRYARQ
jgi:hypothetical protein